MIQHWLALTQLAATVFMTGLIWFVQLVHYPLMARVSPAVMVDYETAHQQRTTVIVAPAMLIEVTAAVGLVVTSPAEIGPLWHTLNLATIALIWASTFFLQMPLHRRLTQRYDKKNIDRLVLTNWPRTALWSVRSALVLWLVLVTGSIRQP